MAFARHSSFRWGRIARDAPRFGSSRAAGFSERCFAPARRPCIRSGRCFPARSSRRLGSAASPASRSGPSRPAGTKRECTPGTTSRGTTGSAPGRGSGSPGTTIERWSPTRKFSADPRRPRPARDGPSRMPTSPCARLIRFCTRPTRARARRFCPSSTERLRGFRRSPRRCRPSTRCSEIPTSRRRIRCSRSSRRSPAATDSVVRRSTRFTPKSKAPPTKVGSTAC